MQLKLKCLVSKGSDTDRFILERDKVCKDRATNNSVCTREGGEELGP